MKVSVIFGTRPEAIKLAPVILVLKSKAGVDCRVCVTGQHRQMLDQVLDAFDIKPDVDLNLMRQDQTLGELSASAIHTLDNYMTLEKPDMVLVQGDTTSVFCAALVAFYHHIPLGHIEAGLRTGNLKSPWPEEANRILTSRLATFHFASTEEARKNLLKEGVPAQAVTVTGNTVIDALLLAVDRVAANPPKIGELPEFLQPGEKHPGQPEMVLITGHRRENFGDGIKELCLGIADLAERFSHIHFVYPVHLNPNVRRPVMEILGKSTGIKGYQQSSHSNVHLIEPLPYLAFVGLMQRAMLLLTDSGGIQEEAPSLGKPVLVMRDTTERPEGIQAGTALLVGTDRRKIVVEVSRLIEDKHTYQIMANTHNPYGDGKAALRIAEMILNVAPVSGL